MSGGKGQGLHNYTVKPGLEGWGYEDLGAASLALIWWLDTHGQADGTVYDMGKRIGVVKLTENYWAWKAAGDSAYYKIDPHTGSIITVRKNGRKKAN